MASLSRCELRNSSRALVRPRAVVCVMSLLGVLVAMALMQLELRFESKDLETETYKLQKERAELLGRQKNLFAELKQLKRYDTVRQYAMDQLGLRECPPDKSSTAVVDARLLAKWNTTGDMALPPQMTKHQPSTAEKFLATVEEKVSFATVSLARDK
ncbi:TPA: hypothetical protein DDW35_06745 [Candidatus Sumerlaeota bacterium]|nr:hypothetical protein [Candidatus Sumerlaeota bacterium]